MNEFEDIDRQLAEAFTQRPSTLSRPSLRDVKHRARRHQRQRKAGVVGACAVVGIGGAAVLATRSPANQTTLGDGATESTICFPTVSTTFRYDTSTAPVNTIPATTLSPDIASIYTIAAGDYPGSVAAMFGVTVAELDAVNRDVPGYGGFIVGTIINIPHPGQIEATTTTEPTGTAVPVTTLFPEPTAWTTTTISEGIRTVHFVQQGDTPQAVANAFDVTLSELDAANVDTPGYAEWVVGAAVLIPLQGAPATSTTFDPDAVDYANCFPVSASTMPEATVSTVLGDTTTTSSTLPSLTKIGTAIQVINCSNQEGVALNLSNALTAEGFTMVAADTGTIDLPVTKVLYNPDDPAAFQVALTVSVFLGHATVEPSGPVLPTATLGTWSPGSSVIVLLGDDLAGKTLAQIATDTGAYTGTTNVPTSTISA